MYGSTSEEKLVKVAASEAWKLLGTLRLAKLIEEALPTLFSKIDVIEGDGAAGTILRVSFPPGREGGFQWFKEKFTVVDDEKLVKETEVVEGGFLDLGFTLYRFRLEVIKAGEKQCIFRYSIEYELKEEAAANAALASIQPLAAVMQIADDYLQRNHNN